MKWIYWYIYLTLFEFYKINSNSNHFNKYRIKDYEKNAYFYKNILIYSILKKIWSKYQQNMQLSSNVNHYAK